jgi:hypothetical protein
MLLEGGRTANVSRDTGLILLLLELHQFCVFLSQTCLLGVESHVRHSGNMLHLNCEVALVDLPERWGIL